MATTQVQVTLHRACVSEKPATQVLRVLNLTPRPHKHRKAVVNNGDGHPCDLTYSSLCPLTTSRAALVTSTWGAVTGLPMSAAIMQRIALQPTRRGLLVFSSDRAVAAVPVVLPAVRLALQFLSRPCQ